MVFTLDFRFLSTGIGDRQNGIISPGFIISALGGDTFNDCSICKPPTIGCDSTTRCRQRAIISNHLTNMLITGADNHSCKRFWRRCRSYRFRTFACEV